LQLGEETSKKNKPKRTTLPVGVDRNNIGVELASKLINLPMKIGDHPVSGKEISFDIGRFGPYLKHDGKFTSIPTQYDPFSLTLAVAVQIIDTPKVPKARSKFKPKAKVK